MGLDEIFHYLNKINHLRGIKCHVSSLRGQNNIWDLTLDSWDLNFGT
jgi:hypothetical protein